MVALPPEIMVENPPAKIISQLKHIEKIQLTGPVMESSFVIPAITLDRASIRSLRQQICSQIASAIGQGTLPNGMRLPSSRLLAKLLNVSRNTVVEAYDKLLEGGLIVVKPGSGVTISHATLGTFPNFSNLRRTARKAHYPLRTLPFDDPDGTAMYLNSTGGN
jgi:DNA-binding transcriptional regulator YhcF (GntR family)